MKRRLILRTVVLSGCVVMLSISFAFAQDFCEGNFDYDDDQDGTDAFTFKTDFGRSSFGNPCPPDGPAPVPKSGQTTSYVVGDDGTHKKGVALPNPRFTDNDDGTVTDNLTGLIWMKDADCFITDPWDQAISHCNLLATGQCGLTDGSSAGDWRLPNKREFFSLLTDAYINPCLSNTVGTGQWSEDDPFIDVHPSMYWSSTTSPHNDNYAFFMHTGTPIINRHEKSTEHYIWCVRGGR